jgi:hypothetical protein
MRQVINTDELNLELIAFIDRYRAEGASNAELYGYFKKVKNFLKLRQYNDVTGILTVADFESFAYIAYLKALEKYNKERWANPIGWIYYLVRQSLLKEIRKLNKKDKTFINSHMNPKLDVEAMEDNDFYEEHMVVDTRQYYLNDVCELCLQIEAVSVKASKTFQLKLSFPDLSRTSIGKILGFRRRNGVAKLVKIIRAVSGRELDKEIIE